MVRTSLYADVAVIFMASFKRDIDNLSVILKGFGEVTGLCTNLHKSSVVPIRCNHFHLNYVLQNMPAARASFPMKYLGLPLSVWKLKAVDFQYLKDKAAGQLVSWEGQHATTAGRTTLVKSVITSQVVFSISALTVP